MDHHLLDKNVIQNKKETPENEVETTPEIPTFESNMLGLQNTLGNSGVQQMLSGTASARPPMFIQAKMTVGAVDDPFEAEADRVAEAVVNQNVQREAALEEEIQAKRIQREAAPEEDELQMKRIQREATLEEDELQMKRIQREAAPEEDELQMKRIQREATLEEDELQMKQIQREATLEEDELQMKRIQREATLEEDELQMKQIQREATLEEDELQMKRIQRSGGKSGSFDVDDQFESQVSSSRGGGQPLDDGVRGKMESSFGDLGDVRVHTDSKSDTLNRQVEARAFTTGRDIFFRQGEYNPGTQEGDKLLAHELTHVVQQTGSKPKQEETA